MRSPNVQRKSCHSAAKRIRNVRFRAAPILTVLLTQFRFRDLITGSHLFGKLKRKQASRFQRWTHFDGHAMHNHRYFVWLDFCANKAARHDTKSPFIHRTRSGREFRWQCIALLSLSVRCDFCMQTFRKWLRVHSVKLEWNRQHLEFGGIYQFSLFFRLHWVSFIASELRRDLFVFSELRGKHAKSVRNVNNETVDSSETV